MVLEVLSRFVSYSGVLLSCVCVLIVCNAY